MAASGDTASAADQKATSASAVGPGPGGHIEIDADAEIAAAIAQSRDILVFRCWQSHKPCAVPGKETGDCTRDPGVYGALAKLRNWRQVFSDMWEGEKVHVWGRIYKTHHHAFQSAKFIAAGLPETADRFTLDSGDPIGQGPAQHARKSGNTVVTLTPEQWKTWEMARPAMKDEIYAAKYRVGTEAARVLLATGDALLINGGKKKVVCIRLMKRREALKAEQS
eukprot:m.163501 g.163501  ORF g.163501 m.163501 type:complete len:223 (+) comp14638_c0_seq6:158-826(+)